MINASFNGRIWIIFSGLILITSISCYNMHKGLPIQEDRDYGLVDGYTSPMSGSSDNEETNNLIRAERSQDSILQDIPDDPNAILEAYEETVAFERKILEQINYTSNQKNLRLSQVEQLERQISRIKASAKLSKEERKRIEREVKSNVDLVLNDSNEQDHTIKCKGCKRQMNTSRAILFMLNNEVWGSSTWTLCDDYGNTKEDSPVYESLAAILNAHTSKTHHVHKCAYCYKAAAIENAKRIYERTKQEHDSLRVEFQQLANSANRSTRRLKKLETELIPRISKKVTFYNDQVEAYRNAAIAMESLRHSAILDYEAVKYGPPNSWGSARER